MEASLWWGFVKMFTNAYGQAKDHGLSVCRFWYKTSDFRPICVRFMQFWAGIIGIRSGFVRESFLSRSKRGKEVFGTAFFVWTS